MTHRFRALACATILTAACADSQLGDADSGSGGGDASLDAKISDARPDGKPSDAGMDGASPDGSSDSGDAAADGGVDVDAAVDSGDGGSGAPCNAVKTGQCGPGLYCDAPNCGIGTCAPAPNESPLEAPVCGCDGVTYWNLSVAETKGATGATKGECALGKACGGSLKCPTGIACNRKLTSASDCNKPNMTGVCWGLPSQCPIVVAPKIRECNALGCNDECGLIGNGAAFYDDLSCP